MRQSVAPIFRGRKIVKVSLYQVNLSLHEGSYKWSGGKFVEVFDSTVVRLETCDGVVGIGEVTPLGPFYLPAFPQGAREGIKSMANVLLGSDPTCINDINDRMDRALKGHPYAKSAVDMACWDILGKVAKLPVCELLGGRFDPPIPLYRAISQNTAEEMATNVDKYYSEGYTKFQLKVGGPPHIDEQRIRAVRKILDAKSPNLLLMCDANTGWKMHEAMQLVNSVRDLNVYIEQPCLSYEECLSVRKHCPLPMILDECIMDLPMLSRLVHDRAADAINLKISKVGGLTKARAIRDFAVSCGIAMNIEDSWGSDIITSAIAHLAHSTPPEYLLCSTDFNSYGPVTTAHTTAQKRCGVMHAPTDIGLGVEPCYNVLGEPVFEAAL